MLTNLLESFFEPPAVSHIDIYKGNRFSIVALADRRLNIASEMPRAVLGEQNIAVMKAITGGDTVSIEEKYKAPRSAKISCKLVFSSNHEIVLPAGDEAFARRMLLIPFRYSVPKAHQDPHLLDRLLDEHAGILYRAILEYRELHQHNCILQAMTASRSILRRLRPVPPTTTALSCSCSSAVTLTASASPRRRISLRRIPPFVRASRSTLCIIRPCSLINFRLCAAVLLRAINSVLQGDPKTATAVFL